MIYIEGGGPIIGGADACGQIEEDGLDKYFCTKMCASMKMLKSSSAILIQFSNLIAHPLTLNF